MLSAAVSNDNARQILGAIQAEVIRLNIVIGQYQTNLGNEMSTYRASVDFDVASLQGDVK